MKYRIFPLGDQALTIDFGNKIAVRLNDRVLRLALFFDRNPFAGYVESVSAYSSLTIFYDLSIVRRNHPQFPTAFAAVKYLAEEALKNLGKLPETGGRRIEIPVCFDAEFAPDLEFIAREKNLSPAEAVKIFLVPAYRVFMLGFLPGFSYMGEVDEKIAVGRKTAPRLKVPAGSVGIAGRQTGVYSLESPGGWQIVGRTPRRLFTPGDDTRESPALLRAGDEVRFYEIDRETFSEESDS